MFSRLFKSRLKPQPSSQEGQQSVLLYITGEDFDRMVVLSESLASAIESTEVGEFDGNEIGGGETVLFMYGRDAEQIFRTVEPILMKDESLHGTKAVIRWGGIGAPQREVIIGPESNQAQ